jgi:cytochrome P450
LNRHLPPGPSSGRWGLRQTKEIERDFIGFGTRLHQEYGDIVHFKLGPISCYQLLHPEHIQEVLIRHAKMFRKSARFKKIFGRLQGNGVVTADGERWAQHRRLIQPVFQAAQLAGHAEIVSQFTERMLDAWPAEGAVDFMAEMRRLTLRIIVRALFSICLDENVDDLGTAVETIQRWGFNQFNRIVIVPNWLPLFGQPAVRRAFALVNGQIDRCIAERRRLSLQRGDLLDQLLNDSGGHRLSDREIHQEAVSLFVSGHETIVIALTWAGWLLARHQEIQNHLAEELTRTLGCGLPGFADLEHLASVEQAFREAVRLYPPLYLFAREVAEEVTIGGYALPPASQVFLSPYLTQRDARWFPDPDRFDPSRFTPDNERGRPACSWFPFGAGPRGCVGRGFAILEATLILTRLIQRFHLQPVQGQDDPKPVAQMHLRPLGGLHITVRRRDSALL